MRRSRLRLAASALAAPGFTAGATQGTESVATLSTSTGAAWSKVQAYLDGGPAPVFRPPGDTPGAM